MIRADLQEEDPVGDVPDVGMEEVEAWEGAGLGPGQDGESLGVILEGSVCSLQDMDSSISGTWRGRDGGGRGVGKGVDAGLRVEVEEHHTVWYKNVHFLPKN